MMRCKSKVNAIDRRVMSSRGYIGPEPSSPPMNWGPPPVVGAPVLHCIHRELR